MQSMTPKHLHKNVEKAACCSKDSVVCFLPTVLTKSVFNVRARTANLKITYVRLFLCTCVHDIHIF